MAADLSKTKLSEALMGSGFDTSQQTLFTCEGLLYYLPQAAVGAFFDDFGRTAALGKIQRDKGNNICQIRIFKIDFYDWSRLNTLKCDDAISAYLFQIQHKY